MDDAGRRAGIPQTVILKGGFESHSRDMDYMHENEVRGYRDFLPVLKLNTPACYFADFDAERRQGIVIMDDLVARGVHFCNPLVPQTHDEVARRLTVLAGFHARSWDSPDIKPGGRWGTVRASLPVFRPYMEQYFVPETWQRFVKSSRGAAASTRFHDSGWMADALDRMIILAERLPHCIVHGDTHLGNLYVDPEGEPGFFDHQPHRAPAMVEVAYHVACALDTADRARWEGALVRHYLDALGRNGIESPGFDEAMGQYGAFLAFGYCIFLINDPFFQPEAVNTAYTARFSAAMLDLGTVDLLKAIK
jgi:hypothetical protein